MLLLLKQTGKVLVKHGQARQDVVSDELSLVDPARVRYDEVPNLISYSHHLLNTGTCALKPA